MKTKLFILAALFAMASLSSCKQDWACTCYFSGPASNTSYYNGTFNQSILEYYVLNATQSEATTACYNHADSLTVYYSYNAIVPEVWRCSL